jgi:hypothetical protein
MSNKLCRLCNINNAVLSRPQSLRLDAKRFGRFEVGRNS